MIRPQAEEHSPCLVIAISSSYHISHHTFGLCCFTWKVEHMACMRSFRYDSRILAHLIVSVPSY